MLELTTQRQRALHAGNVLWGVISIDLKVVFPKQGQCTADGLLAYVLASMAAS